MDEEEYEEIAGKRLRLDIIDCEMILVCVLFFFAVLGDGNEGGIEVPGVANTAKEEGEASTIISGEFGGVELGLCRVMAKIVVFGGFGAPATDQLQKQLLYHQKSPKVQRHTYKLGRYFGVSSVIPKISSSSINP